MFVNDLSAEDAVAQAAEASNDAIASYNDRVGE
jgi:hypothetical protein